MTHTRKRFAIQGMHCVGCAMTIDDALESLPGVEKVATHYARQVVDVEYDATRVSEAEIVAAIARAGYRAHEAQT